MFAGTQFGRYEIRSKIGEGGMGEVYSAHDTELDREVAIKLLPNEFLSDEDRRGRFKQEARVVSSINHPNIITIYEIGENEYGSFLATEFVEGRTLRQIMKTESITLVRVLRIIEQAANALVAAHAAKIIHRDIKPENIMVRHDAIVKVLDFGLAKPIIELGSVDQTSSNKTIPGTVMGSARYMSPEQARGHEVDERTDIWSLGVVLYEMLTGHPPFDGETTADTIAAVVYKEPVPLAHLLPNVPFELQRILRKALQKDREERYQNVKDLALDIKDLLYTIEHANSGDRTAHVISDPNFSENPTVVHRTVRGEQRTNFVGPRSSSPDHFRGTGRSLGKTALAAGALLLLLTAIGLGLLNWFSAEPPLSANAFAAPQVSRVITDGRVMQPAISPDGKYIAYISGEMGERRLVVRQIATDSIVTLVQPTNLNLLFVSFSPNGDWVYYTETRSDYAVNTLYQVPTLGGTPKKLIEDVDGTITFSPDGKRFAFVRHIGKTNEDVIFIADATTLEQTRLISTKDTEYQSFSNRFAWSPDGSRLLLGAGIREGGFLSRMDIVTVDISKLDLEKLGTRSFHFLNSFVWFSDGSGFVFTGRETLNAPTQVWRATYPDADLVQVTNDINDYGDVGISADGRSLITIKGDTIGGIWNLSSPKANAAQLTMDSRGVEGMFGLAQFADGSLLYSRNKVKESDLWVAGKDGKGERALFADQGFAVSPSISPDGRYIVFNRQKDNTSQIWRMDADGANPIRLTNGGAEIIDLNPQITPDGNYVIFQRQIIGQDRFSIMRIPLIGGDAEIFHQNETQGFFNPKVSPDGKRVAYGSYDLSTLEKKLNIATLENGRFGKHERVIEYNLINNFAWSPDSRSLTILTNRGGSHNLWRQPIDGSAATPITDFKSGRIFNFAWGNDGRSLLISRGNTNNDLILVRETSENVRTTESVRTTQRKRAVAWPFSYIFGNLP